MKTEQEVTELIELFQRIGYPVNLKHVLGGEDAEQVIDAFARKEPVTAYLSGKKTGDSELTRRAGEVLLETDPRFIVSFGKGDDNDAEFLRRAGEKLLETDPVNAYYAADIINDMDLINRAGQKALETRPGVAYAAGVKSGDNELVRKAGWKMLEGLEKKGGEFSTYKTIYSAGIISGDESLTLKAEDALVNYSAVFAYDVGAAVKNERLIEKARKKLVEEEDGGRVAGLIIFAKDRSDPTLARGAGLKILDTNPFEAYGAGKYAGDAELMGAALDKIANSRSESIKGLVKQLYTE